MKKDRQDELERLLRRVAKLLAPSMPVGRVLRFIAADTDAPEAPAVEFVISVTGRGVVSLPAAGPPPLVLVVPLSAEEAAVLSALSRRPLKASALARHAGRPCSGPFREFLSHLRKVRHLIDWHGFCGYVLTPAGRASIDAHRP